MALGYQVSGPAKVLMATEGTTLTEGSHSAGFMDNNDLASWSIEYRHNILQATDTGQEPGAIVYAGAVCLISLTMSKIDLSASNQGFGSILDPLFYGPGANDQGEVGVVGTELYTNSAFLALSILPTTASRTQYTFPRCFIDGPDAVRVFDYGGNVGSKIALNLVVLRGGSASNLPDGSSATATFWSTSATT